MKKMPLVSILIPNYNHSKYLSQCIESALGQTYPNIEIVVLDNNSSDQSMKIAREYQKSGVRVCRNEKNIYAESFRILSENLTGGEYLMLLPADDYILPEFVETCVTIMEAHHNVGYVHTERDFIKDTGEVLELDPFYRCSFIAEGRKTMPVYMMTTVAHPAQGIYRRSSFQKINGYDAEIDYANIDKTLWFYLSAVSDYAYVAKKLARVRIGLNTETTLTQNNFQQPVLLYLTLKNFVEYAKMEGIEEVYQREGEAFDKLASELLSVCAKLLLQGDDSTTEKYFLFCKIISRKIEQNEKYQRLYSIWETKNPDEEFLIQCSADHFNHKRSYQPPEGYCEIEE